MKDQFLAELRAEISAAAHREHERMNRGRRRRDVMRVGALAATVVVAVFAAVFVVSAPEANAGVEISRSGDDLVVRLTDLETRPEEVAHAAAEAGLDVTVAEVPVGPSNVGRFIAAEAEGGYPPDLRVVDGDPSTAFLGFRIPAGYDGRLDLLMGRAAGSGDAWAVASDATARGELLECADVVGARLAEVTDAVPSGIDTQILLLDEGAFLSSDDALRHHGDALIVRATSPAPATLWIEVTEQPERFPLSDTGKGC